MYHLKFVNVYQYLHKRTLLHAISPRIKVYIVILWFIFNFYSPSIIFWLIVLILVLLSFDLQLVVEFVILRCFYQSQMYFSSLILLLVTVSMPSTFFQRLLLIQIIRTKINCRSFQYFLRIGRAFHPYFVNSHILSQILIPYLILKQYLLLISYLCFGILLVMTTMEEELISAYLSVFLMGRQDNMNNPRFLFCFSIAKQYEYLVIKKATNVLYSIKFRGVDFCSLNSDCNFIYLVSLCLEAFIGKFLVCSRRISECLYSRQLITTTVNLHSN